ncbi:MAG: PilZ domain-containing protein [Candidatus Omnitrophota bacterium]
MVEKRNSVRFKAPFYLKWSLADSCQEFSAIGKDINAKGVKLLLDKPHGVAAENYVSLHLLLPDKTLGVVGKVVWIQNYPDRQELGVNFVKIIDSYKQDILDYIFKYYPQELTRRWWQ